MNANSRIASYAKDAQLRERRRPPLKRLVATAERDGRSPAKTGRSLSLSNSPGTGHSLCFCFVEKRGAGETVLGNKFAILLPREPGRATLGNTH